MKKVFLAAVLFCSLSAFAHLRVDEKLEQKFRESFPAATSVKWYDNKDSYEVFFMQNKVMCRIRYSIDGVMEQMRRDYTSEALPVFIANAVQQKFPGKKVYGVTEITMPEGLQYHIVAEDSKHWFFLNSTSGGDVTLTRRLRKS